MGTRNNSYFVGLWPLLKLLESESEKLKCPRQWKFVFDVAYRVTESMVVNSTVKIFDGALLCSVVKTVSSQNKK